MQASKLNKAYNALHIYDYFKAKRYFYKINASKPNPYSCYGLAIIYARTDNPFSNVDSACRYITLANNYYQPGSGIKKFPGFLVDSMAMLNLADSIAQMQFERVKKQISVASLNHFLTHNYLATDKLKKQAVYLRDELEFNQVMQTNRSDTTALFIATHPQSSFYSEALILKDRELYDELTEDDLPSTFISFIKNHPKNVLLNTAYEKLFGIYRQRADAAGLTAFVSNYPKAPQNLEAWKLLFSLTVKSFSYNELKKFLEVYPEFPLKYSILKELELNKLVLYPYQQNDYTGFINEEGRFAIEPVYDAVSDFYEGLAVVNKNDSVFFINKENVNPFQKTYIDAMVFKNGIAPVKQNNHWFFINRQGQSISGLYDEINELSNSVYVVKNNGKYGALDQYGQTLIEPRFDKLGDFKNDFAYYTDNGAYGFVSVSGQVYKAAFEWISDFDEQQLAIVKRNNKYGLVNGNGSMVLEPLYDLILKTSGPYYLLVSNATYGFFSASGCFVTPLSYEYQKDKIPEFYSNGRQFKLLKKNTQLIVDENGNTLINSENYAEINFSNYNLSRVKKKKKYGFLDKRLNTAIPFKYEWASDFQDSAALVKHKENYQLINLQGKEMFSSTLPIEKISGHYYLLNGEAKSIVNNRGQVVLKEVAGLAKINARLFIVTLINGEIKLLSD
ncbi:MAG: WG repeat-containing protein [Bacteroidia bacterium]|nr:WG repeat-containing protein [Bacteroidia bacterium]